MAETNSNPDPSGRNAARKLTYTLPEAAAEIGMRVSWLKEKVDKREVPFTQIGKVSVGFTAEQLAQVIEALTVKPSKTPTSLTSARAKKRAA